MTSRPLFMSVAESIVIFAAHRPRRVGQRLLDGHVLELGARAPAEGAAAGGQHELLDAARALARTRAGAARSARSRRAGSGRPVASASCMTSSPPTTSDSLLASARSMPSPSVATVGPSPAEPTSALSTRSGWDSSTRRTSPSAPDEHLAVGPRLGGARARVGVGQRDARHAVRAGLGDQRLPGPLRAQADELEVVGPLDDVERLGADRAGRAEDEQATGHARGW